MDTIGRWDNTVIILEGGITAAKHSNIPGSRKTFLVISGLGTGVTTALLATSFWANKQPGQSVLGSSILHNFLTNHVFLVVVLVLYIAFFNLGFGPIRYTLQSELFTPKEQVRRNKQPRS